MLYQNRVSGIGLSLRRIEFGTRQADTPRFDIAALRFQEMRVGGDDAFEQGASVFHYGGVPRREIVDNGGADAGFVEGIHSVSTVAAAAAEFRAFIFSSRRPAQSSYRTMRGGVEMSVQWMVPTGVGSVRS